MNSGVLADPRPGRTFDYAPAPPGGHRPRPGARGRLRAPRRPTARRRDAVPAGPPGGRRVDRRRPHASTISRSTRELLRLPIPAALWADLRSSGPHRRRRAGPGMTVDVIDAHHHLIGPGPRATIRGSPATLAAIRSSLRGRRTSPRSWHAPASTRTIVVQTLSSASRDAASSSHGRRARRGSPASSAGSTSPSPGVAEDLAALRAAPGGDRLVGIRHQVHDEPDPDWLLPPGRPARASRPSSGPAWSTTCSSGPGSCPAALGRAATIPACASSSTTWPSRRSATATHRSPWAELPRAVRPARQRTVQALGPRHRGRLVGLDDRRSRAGRRAGARRLRARSAALRLGLAGLPAGRVVRRRRGRGARRSPPGSPPSERASIFGGAAARAYDVAPWTTPRPMTA